MIVAERKSFGEVKGYLDPYRRLLIAGCGSCATVCLAGGEEEVKILASSLRIAYLREQQEKQIIEDCATRQCEPEFAEQIVQRVREAEIEAVLSLGCGVGVNTLAQFLEDIPVFPGLNTRFMGGSLEPGVWAEMCAGCGECILHLTGGICPVARCAKSMLNGPCGGSNNGKCELGEETDCAWVLIIERMKKLGTLERLYEIQPPRDWSHSAHGGPRRQVHEALAAHSAPAVQAASPGGDDIHGGPLGRRG